MAYKGYADRPSMLMIDRLPGWASAMAILTACAVTLNSLGSDWDGLKRKPNKMGLWYILGLLNIVLVVAGVLSLWRKFLGLRESWHEASEFIERVWQIVTQGAGRAGLVGKDLGEADEDGVYTRETKTGNKIFLRLSKSLSGGEVWEWSFDKKLWMPASKADHFWNGSYGVSAAADKILIRRLEVECALRAQQPSIPTCTHPPPIDLEELDDKARKRMMKCVPKEYLCQMSMKIMTQPVVSPSGVTYNRDTIEEWINEHHTDPATKSPLRNDHLYPNLALRDMIQKWLVEHKFIRT